MIFQKKNQGYTSSQAPVQKNRQKLIALGALAGLAVFILAMSYLMKSTQNSSSSPKNSHIIEFRTFSITVPNDFESSSGGPKEQIISPQESSSRINSGDYIKVQKYIQNKGDQSLTKVKRTTTVDINGSPIPGQTLKDLKVGDSEALEIKSSGGQTTKVRYYIAKPKYIWLVEIGSKEAEAAVVTNSETIAKSLKEN